VAGLLYGSGLRFMEGLRLRVQDLDFGHRQITARSGKGDKDRLTLVPERLVAPLGQHLKGVHQVQGDDLAAGWGEVFSQSRRWRDPANGNEGRHHLEASIVQKEVRKAVQATGIPQRVRRRHPLHSGAAWPQRHSGDCR
jgi:integrase